MASRRVKKLTKNAARAHYVKTLEDALGLDMSKVWEPMVENYLTVSPSE